MKIYNCRATALKCNGKTIVYHDYNMRENFSLAICSLMMLYLVEVAQSDSCKKPLFSNPVAHGE